MFDPVGIPWLFIAVSGNPYWELFCGFVVPPVLMVSLSVCACMVIRTVGDKDR